MKKFIITCLFTVLALTTVQADIYVVVAGISDYKEISDLRLPENDAKAVAEIYKTRTKNVIIMTGKYATKANILKALNDQFARANEDDMVVFYFSGHGYQGGFCPYDMDNLGKNGLQYKEIYSIMKNCKANRKLIIADACLAGGMRVSGKATEDEIEDENIVLFLSSRTKENSIENRRMTNGFFTTYLCKGLRGSADVDLNKFITAKEIFEYVNKNVNELSGGKQHPVMWGHFDDDFIIIDWSDK